MDKIEVSTPYANKLVRFGKRIVFGVLALLFIFLILVGASIPISRFNQPDLSILPHLSFQAESSGRYILHNFKRVDITNNQIIEDEAILIDNGKILAIEPAAELNPKLDWQSSRKVDANGRYLMPGLVDAHVHVFDSQDLGLYLSHGITSVRNMAGMPVHLRWQELASKGGFTGARLLTYSPALNAGNDIGPFHKRVESAEHGRHLVNDLYNQGYQGIKIYNGLTQSMTEAIIDEAQKLGLPVAGHPSNAFEFRKVLDLKMQSLEHVEELFQVGLNYKASKESVDKLTDDIVASQTPVVTTLVAFDNIYQASRLKTEFKKSIDWNYLTSFTAFVGEKQLSPQFEGVDGKWESAKTRAMHAITRSLFAKNAKMAIGSDTGPALTMPGLSFHRELEILSSLNIEPQKILLAATEHSASVLNQPGITGKIETGTIADLLLLVDNPLENTQALKEPESVIFAGQILTKENLSELRKQGQDHHSFYTIVGWLVESLVF